jgi:hypothetical protein
MRRRTLALAAFIGGLMLGALLIEFKDHMALPRMSDNFAVMARCVSTGP